MTFEIRYRVDGFERLICLDQKEETADLTAEVVRTSETVKLTLTPKKPIELMRVEGSMPFQFKKKDAILPNGYQSWTDTNEHTVNGRVRGVDHLPNFMQKPFALRAYGDYDFTEYSKRRGELHGWSYGYVRRGKEFHLFASVNERTGFTEIRFLVPEQSVRVKKDCAGLVISAPYDAMELCILKGEENQVFDRWFDLMQIEPPKAKPITGYTSWYNFYQDINEEKILQNLQAVEQSPMHFDVFQIDDGYQTAVGDWLSIDQKKFPNGLKPIADRVRESGMMPGLWMAPFSCQKKSKVAKQHPDWLLRGTDGKLILCGANWGGFYALDLYHPEAREYIKTCLQTAVREWGFELLKLDFLYSVCLRPTSERTRGQIMCEAMDFIRETVPEAKILGCGVPLWAAFGKVDYCRIGCDVGLDYDDTPIMRIIHRERVSTKHSIRNTVFRRQLNGRAFWNDPDVFLLRDENISLTWQQRVTLAKVNALFGSVKFTSDDVSSYHAEQKRVLQTVLHTKAPKEVRVKLMGKSFQIDADGEVLNV